MMELVAKYMTREDVAYWFARFEADGWGPPEGYWEFLRFLCEVVEREGVDPWTAYDWVCKRFQDYFRLK